MVTASLVSSMLTSAMLATIAGKPPADQRLVTASLDRSALTSAMLVTLVARFKLKCFTGYLMNAINLVLSHMLCYECFFSFPFLVLSPGCNAFFCAL